MSEETPAIKNKKQLLVGGILALLVVVIYNYHIRQVREAGKGETVRLIRFLHDMFPGQKIDAKDVRVVEVSAKYVKNLGGVVKVEPQDEVRDVVGGYTLTQAVQEGWLLQTAHLGLGGRRSPSDLIPKGMVAVQLQMDPKAAPGDMLNIGDRVNVLGMFQIDKAPTQWYPIVEGVKVLAVGGRGPKDLTVAGASHFQDTGPRSYKSIVIQMPAAQSKKLLNVLSHVQGSVAIEIINPMEAPPDDKNIRINSVLAKLAEAALPPEAGL